MDVIVHHIITGRILLLLGVAGGQMQLYSMRLLMMFPSDIKNTK